MLICSVMVFHLCFYLTCRMSWCYKVGLFFTLTLMVISINREQFPSHCSASDVFLKRRLRSWKVLIPGNVQASHKRDLVTQLFLQFHTSWRNEEVKNWNFNQLKVLCLRGALSFIVFLQHCDERTQILLHAVCLQQISWANSWQEWEVQINLAAVRCSPFSKGKTESTSFFIYFLSFLVVFFLLVAAFQNPKWVWMPMFCLAGVGSLSECVALTESFRTK